MVSNLHRCISGAVACLLFALVLSVPNALKAQTAMASLQGLVTDSSGAVVPGATVELVSEATNVKQTRKTDPRGFYLFEFLPPASYRLTVTMNGFETFVRSDMPLETQQTARVDVVLKPGVITTKVEVIGEAPRLDTTTATQGQVITTNEMLNLPNIGRDAQSLLALSPNVVGVGGKPGDAGSSFNGGRIYGTDLLMDGVTTQVQTPLSGMFNNIVSPKQDEIQEMKVQTNQFSAEYGSTGSAVVTMVSRSGTNGLHGDVYDYHTD